MHVVVHAPREAEVLSSPVGEHLVRVHVVRRAGARLIDVDDELIAQAAAEDLVGGGDDGGGDGRIEPQEIAVRFGRGLLDQHRCGDEIRRRAQAADREVVDCAGGLHAVVGGGGDIQLPQRVALGAERHGPIILT